MFDFFKRKPDAAPAEAPPAAPPEPPRSSWTDRLRGGLSASRDKLSDVLRELLECKRILERAREA